MRKDHFTTNTLLIPDKVSALRLEYERETATIKKKYHEQLNIIEGEILRVQNTDYAAKYHETFTESLHSLEKLFDEMKVVHDSTQGLQFRIGEYIDRCKPKKIGYGKVHEHFSVLSKKCCDAVNAVACSQTIEDDIEPLKQFCQCLVDLRYIKSNADRLIDDSGVAERERKADMAGYLETKERLLAEEKNASRFEKLACYGDIVALREEILAEYSKLNEDILGGGQLGFDNTYRFLVGFYKMKIDKADMDFATSLLQVPEEAVSRVPIYFHYTADHDSILIKAPSSFLATNQFNDFIRNLYFSFASRLPARNLLFCGIECNTIDAVVGGLGEKIQQLGSAYLCHEVVDRGNDLNASGGILSTLRGIANENSKKQKGESINNIFEYNEVFPDNPQKFVFFCVNNYPAGFQSASGSVMQDMRQLINGGTKGIISVICETTDGDYSDSAPMLTAQELNADCVEFTEDGEMYYNGRLADCKITAFDFSPRDYWYTLDKYFKSAASISLESLLKASDRVYNKPDPIAIPVGNSDGEVFHLELTECTDRMFGLIIGSVGSGKSAFLHTLILSAAYNNSPEDLQFYLADFKDGSGSTEFSHYRKDERVNNLYIPHVRYLLLKGKTESAFDLLEKIESIRSKRAEILTRAGCSQVTDYNRSPAVLSGKEQKLPHIFFIIDEYNAMLNGGNGMQNASSPEIAVAIAAKIRNLISTARAYGIGIILCGQSVDKALKNGQALGNMGCRISLPIKNDSELVSLFDLDSYDAKKQMQKLAGQGDALVSLGNTSNLRYVRTAYSGKTNGAQQLRIAEAIRQKYRGYETTQVEAGSENAVLITDLGENEIGYRARGNELLLEMGVSSANALRMPLVFSTVEASFNYYACASKDKLCKIERNAMFAFLQSGCADRTIDGFYPVTYLSVRDKQQECLGEYLSIAPVLRQKIELIDNKTDMAKKLMALRKLYRERKRAVDRGTASHFEPLFVVLRDVTWLADKEAEWLPDFSAVQERSEAGSSSAPTSAELGSLSAIAAKTGKSISAETMSMIMGAGNLNVNMATAGKSQTQERFTVADVRMALASLYAYGNRYGIFLLVSSETYKPINDILMSEVDDKNLALNKYGIFGSFEESKHHMVDPTAPKDCIFINYFNSKTRLYDYSPDSCRAWWKSFP